MRIFVVLAVILILGCAQSVDTQEADLPINTEDIEEESNPVEESEESADPSTEPLDLDIGNEEVEPIPVSDAKPEEYTDPEVQEKLDLAYEELHEPGSSHQIFEDFPDVELVYEDTPSSGDFFPNDILPFKYYYSDTANSTFNICNVERTVFICKGKLDREITKNDIDSGRCEITSEYLADPRLGGNGELDFNYLN